MRPSCPRERCSYPSRSRAWTAAGEPARETGHSGGALPAQPRDTVTHCVAAGVVIDELGQRAQHGVLELLVAVPLETIRRGALQPGDGAALLLGHALAVPRDVERSLNREGACREAAVPHIGLAQDHDRLAEAPRGEQAEHALASTPRAPAPPRKGDTQRTVPCTTGVLTSGLDLLLHVDVVVLVVLVEVDLARGQHGG
eukprot:scaffold101782_cov55-Phaeocystis_antarctica.AAC.3